MLFRVVVDKIVVGFHCAFELVANFVYLLDFEIGNYYCMTLGDDLFVFVCFVYIVRKDLADKKSLVEQCSNYCVAHWY